MLGSYIVVNFSSIAINVPKHGSKIITQPYCSIPRLERNFYLFQLFQRFIMGLMSKYFLNSMKEQRILVLLNCGIPT
jgi:hypothetical protein